MSVQNPPIQPIIIKKKIVHAGHHGGAWKVAYADFVTAMMALFIVLWLMSSSEQVKKAVAGYFRDPSGKGAETGTGKTGASEDIGIGKNDMAKLQEKLESAIRQAPELAKLRDQVQMTVTGEGLRIELLESEVGTFFESGNAHPSDSGKEMLKMLAVELGKVRNRLLIEGHTDARPFASSGTYSNWELSADRSNSARKLMQERGLGANQVAEVRGFADQRLRKPADPNNASNRRVSIVVKYDLIPEAGNAAVPAHAMPAAGHESTPQKAGHPER